jgi:nucleotide-binding universal stress UspA family protein
MISAATQQGEARMAIKRILVPVDFSEDSLNALAYASDFAEPFGAELVVLYVVEPTYYATPVDMYVTTPNMAMLLDEQRRVGAQQLARITAGLEKKGRRVRSLLKTGAPAQVIVDSAKSVGADMIILSTHGRTGLAHMLMGSVAEKVVRHSGCPVLTVRHGTLRPRRTPKKARRAQKK